MSIVVRNLQKQFLDKKHGNIKAVDDVSFQCLPGSIFGLLGLNGAGKTTILRIVCTVIKADSGQVSVSGFDVNSQSAEVRKNIGFLPAESGVYHFLTPREILAYYARLCKYPENKVKERVDEVIESLGMVEYADKYAKGLSSGMKQKICLARAIIHDPPVIIFDEPTNSLDVITRVSVHEFIAQRRSEGKTVILSTHIMSEAEKLCDQIGILHKGRLLALGTLEQLRETTGLTNLEDIFIWCVRNKKVELV